MKNRNVVTRSYSNVESYLIFIRRDKDRRFDHDLTCRSEDPFPNKIFTKSKIYIPSIPVIQLRMHTPLLLLPHVLNDSKDSNIIKIQK